MSRRVSGEVRSYRRKNGLTTFSLRFSAYGRRRTQTLGTEAEGWTPARAELELRNTLARVEAGIWAPREPTAEVGEEPTFHEFASCWLTRRGHELRETTLSDYRWRLSRHLLPFFCDYRPSDIDIDLVDRYREHKLIERDEIAHAKAAGVVLRDAAGRAQRPLANESINKTLALLATILDDAVERGWLATNPARGRGRRLKAPRPHGTFLEPDELNSLLEAAGHIEQEARSDQKIARREIVATLALAGLRVTELCRLRWKQFDFSHARIDIPTRRRRPASARST